MRMFFGMILGALLLTGGVYIHDSLQTPIAAGGETAQNNQTLVNWDVAALEWQALKRRTHDNWMRISSR